jgi:hypothetical protein
MGPPAYGCPLSRFDPLDAGNGTVLRSSIYTFQVLDERDTGRSTSEHPFVCNCQLNLLQLEHALSQDFIGFCWRAVSWLT